MYLHILSIEMSRAWAELVAEEVGSINADDSEQRYQFLFSEVGRLLDHPDLFPSDEARVRFLAILSLDSELRFTSVYTNLLIELELEDLEEITEREFSRSSYSEGYTGWENFLFNTAPGAPKDVTDRKEAKSKTSLQMLPPVAMRIVNDLAAEEKHVLKFMEDSGSQPHATSTGTSITADLEKKSASNAEVPISLLPRHAYDATVHANPFQQAIQTEFIRLFY
jgi:hypothetical protein